MKTKSGRILIPVCACIILLICAICSCTQIITGNDNNNNDPVVITAAPTELGEEYVTGAVPETKAETLSPDIETEIEYKTDDNGEVYTQIVIIEPESDSGYEYIAQLEAIDHLDHGTEYKYITALSAESLLKLMKETLEGKNIPVGGFITPAASLRDERTGAEGTLDAAYAKLAKLGLTFVISQDEWSSPVWSMESLAAARKAGMKLWYNCGGQDSSVAISRLQALRSSPDAEALAGVIVSTDFKDNDLEMLAETSKVIRRELGTDNTLKVLSILPPPYASNVTDNYVNFVKSYAGKTNPYVMLTDYAPYRGVVGNSISEYITVLNVLRTTANATVFQNMAGTNVYPSMYATVQCSGSGSLRKPTLNELRLNAHLALACGAKGIIYSNVCEQEYGSMTGLIDKNGNITEMYKMVSAVNHEIQGLHGRFISMTCSKILVLNNESLANSLTAAGVHYNKKNFGFINTISTEGDKPLFAGYFTVSSTSAGEGYYLVNTDTEAPLTVTMTFAKPQALVLWSGKGCEYVNWVDDFTVTLAPGEGVFVENTGLDYDKTQMNQ